MLQACCRSLLRRRPRQHSWGAVLQALNGADAESARPASMRQLRQQSGAAAAAAQTASPFGMARAGPRPEASAATATAEATSRAIDSTGIDPVAKV